jgi:hypothetical protein
MIVSGRHFNINKNEKTLSNMQNRTGRRWKSLYFKMQKIWTNQTQILWQSVENTELIFFLIMLRIKWKFY